MQIPNILFALFLGLISPDSNADCGVFLNPLQSGLFKSQADLNQVTSNPDIARVMGAKDFSERERLDVERVLKALAERLPSLAPVLNYVSSRRDFALYRTSFGYKLAMTNNYAVAMVRSETVVAWALPRVAAMGFTDRFFLDLPNPTALFPPGHPDAQAAVALHEIFHLFDNENRFSKSPTFQRLIVLKYPRDINRNALREIRAKAEDLFNRQSVYEAQQLLLNFAHDHGLPTSYAFDDPAEAFAEIGVAYFLDPEFKSYAHPDVIAWFERVLSARGL